MKTFIVSWTLLKIVEVTCPCNQPQYDEWGRQTNAHFTLALLCTSTVEDHHYKLFTNFSEANSFYLRTIENKQEQRDITYVKLDSIPGYYPNGKLPPAPTMY
jgi:hypothetical protein